MRSTHITLTVNGTVRSAPAEARTLLSDFLRHALGLTGTHVGCEQGACGACTVLVDDEPVRSCLMLAVQADGRRVETVESIAPDAELDGLQRSMSAEHGLQCGFCTPGLLMALRHAERVGLGAAEAVDDVLPGHVCRCTGYGGIRSAVHRHWESAEEGR